MNIPLPQKCQTRSLRFVRSITTVCLGMIGLSALPMMQAAEIAWTGATSSDWMTDANWDSSTVPTTTDYAYITSGTPSFSAGTTSFRGIRMAGGAMTISGGTLNATAQASAQSHVDSTIVQTGGEADINEIEIGRTAGATGSIVVSGGTFNVGRAVNDHSLYIGANSASTSAGTGSFQISGGSMATRSAVKLGDTSVAGVGNFTVLGSSIVQVGIGASNDDIDGVWTQNAGSTLKVGIDFGGVTPILIKDSDTATTGTSATFASGALLNVDYYGTGYGGGTWTVMEVENGDVINNGLAFAAGVDTSVWSFSVDNSGANGLLQVTATGDPAGIELTVGNTPKQQMRYGMDYERLWYWSSSLNASEKDLVSKWSVVDNDVDFVRVAINSKYELTEGTYDLSAYTSKIIPMMQDMQDANPDIKFFASPRPLDEAVSGAKWQPYPIWITGASSYTSSSFNFDWQNCAEYLVRYINLMKSYGFKISYLDVTNEWNYIDTGDYRDIKAYMEANLDAEDIPLLIGPSAWNYTQGKNWLSDATTTARKAAVDIAGCHNTDSTGTAQDFADRAESILPGKEIWNTEVHDWKSTGGMDEVLSVSYLFECVRAGFSGLSGWLAIGTSNQGHSFILNPNGVPTRNVKYFMYNKLTNTSHRGYALDINQPAEFEADSSSPEADAGTSTSALIRGNLMTVWVMNHADQSYPIRINPTGRTLSETTVKRTRWSEVAGLAEEGVTDHIDVTDDTFVWSIVAANSVYCFEVLLDPEATPYTTFEGEASSANSGTTTETCSDIGGGVNVANINPDTWRSYDNIDLSLSSSIRFRVARPAGRPEGDLEIRLGSSTGTLIGSVRVPETGGWQTWETIETPIDPTSGTQTLYLNFVSTDSAATAAMFNLNWFELTVANGPTGVVASATSASQVNLSWDAVAGATGYNVKRSTTSGSGYSTVGSTTSTSFSNTGLSATTTYYYVVTAVLDGTESIQSTEAVAQRTSTSEDSSRAITLAGTSGFAVLTQPSNGSLSGSAPSLVYMPNVNFNGTDSFTYSVNDGTGNSASSSVWITVSAVNDAPVAAAKSLTTAEDTAKAITLTGSDVEGSALTASVVSQPANGTVTLSGNVATYAPSANFNGTSSFTYRMYDGSAYSASATVSLTVTAVNDAPVASAQSVSTAEDVAKSITLAGSDVEGDSLSYTILSQPSKGALSGSGTSRTYTPNANANGSDSFTFRVNDGSANSATATVSINISAVNDAPEFSDGAYVGPYTDAGLAYNSTLEDLATDVDGDALTYSKQSGPAWLLVSASGELSGTPAAGDSGLNTWTLEVSDGNGASDTATLEITVNLTQGLVAQWSMQEGTGTVVSDGTGNGFAATAVDCTWMGGVTGSALDFNGSTSRVTLPAEAFGSVSDEVTIALWAYGDTSLPKNNSVFSATNSSGNRLLNIHLPWSNSQVYWDAGDASGYDRINKAATAAEYKDGWNHWIFTKNATTGVMNIYLNGVLWHTGTGKSKSVGEVTSAAFGAQISSLSYDGVMDDVLLYNVELSVAEVEELYNSYTVDLGEFTSQSDIGSPSLAGTASYVDGAYTIEGSGADIYNTQDSFNYVFIDHSGDGELIARVDSVENTNTWAKAGLMFRETIAADSSEVMLLVRPDKQVSLQYRASAGAASVSMGLFGNTTDVKWIKLVRDGDSFTGYYSSNGEGWTLVSQATVSMTSNVTGGLAVTSHNTAALSTAVFSNVSIEATTTGYFSSAGDVGTPSLTGSFQHAGDAYILEGGGSDIYGSSDNFHFASQLRSGDMEIVALVSDVENTDTWAKGGVMIRETLDANSKEIAIVVRPDKQVSMQYRGTTGGGTSVLTSGGVVGDTTNAKWIRLVRTGDSFSGYYSIDGVTWVVLSTQALAMTSEVEVGLAVTSHNDSTLSTATFTDVAID